MKKLTLILFLCFISYHVFSQQLHNSWIDYNKTYYKFKISKDSLCRIPQTALAAIGLGNTPAEHFQLWRNGEQVALHTTSTTGPLSANGYIEFWAQRNDGKPDNELYLEKDYQLSQKWSLETDSAVFYLTVNTGGNNLRYSTEINPVAGSTLPREPYFMRKVDLDNKGGFAFGFGAYLGEIVYSSSYDKGEGWAGFTGNAIAATFSTINNLNVNFNATNEKVTYTIGASGLTLHARDVKSYIQGYGQFQSSPMPFYEYKKDTVRDLPLSLLNSANGPSNSVTVLIQSNSGNANDRYWVGNYSFTYPAYFNFNNQNKFNFSVRPSTGSKFISIFNFNNSGVAPVLIDLSNNKRFIGDISVPDSVRFVIPPSSLARNFVLVSQSADAVGNITSLTMKNFVNFQNAANQGDYLIITHPKLTNDGNGNNKVEEYRAYRASARGGGFNAKVYDINELTEQFAFGITRHPSATRDFVRFATNSFAVKPKFLLLMGRGGQYPDYFETNGVANPNNGTLNLIPAFGFPASDILLTTEPGKLVPLIPVGRIGAINGSEIGIYLDKVKTYEGALASTVQTIENKDWMKHILLAAGGSDSFETADFIDYLRVYKQNFEDSAFGGSATIYAKSSVAAIEQQQNAAIESLLNGGLGIVKYFGHSSANDIAVGPLNRPEAYKNYGKFSFMHVSGCTVGNYYTSSNQRTNGYAGMSLSEKYIFLPNLGAIGFLASTHWGVAPFLHYYNTNLTSNLSKGMYGKTIGEQIQQTIRTIGSSPVVDYYTRLHIEEINLHGDPAIVVGGFQKPDFVIEDPQVKISPTLLTVANANFNVSANFKNIGRAVGDSIRVTIKHRIPNGDIRVLYNQLIPSIKYDKLIEMTVPIVPFTDKGLNRLILTVDDGNRINELEEMNNSITKDFFIFEDEIKPVQPYNYAIVNNQNVKFYANTSNPLSTTRQYILEVDTTMNFNSTFKKTSSLTGIGGLIEFAKPAGLTMVDSTVYYWRVAVVPVNGAQYIWNSSSFVYLQNSTDGFNQSHYFQYVNNGYQNSFLQNNRQFRFDNKKSKYQIRTAIFGAGSNQLPNFMIYKDDNAAQGAIYNGSLGLIGTNSNSMRFFVIDTVTGNLWKNEVVGTTGQYGSTAPILFGSQLPGWFQFKIETLAQRQVAMDFIDAIPAGNTIVLTNTVYGGFGIFPSVWQGDTATLGSGVSLYHKLKSIGFTHIDSARNAYLPFVFITKKGLNQAVFQKVGLFNERLDHEFFVESPNLSGSVTSEDFGPASKWLDLHWAGRSLEANNTDKNRIVIYGVKSSGAVDSLRTVFQAQDSSLAWVDAKIYPTLRLKLVTTDSTYGTPSQLKYWRVNGIPMPEGAIAPNILYALRDTVEQGELLEFKMAFKNISNINFDSTMKFKMLLTNRNNFTQTVSIPRGKLLVAGDTLVVKTTIDTKNFPGNNSMFLDINPDNHQNEQTHINNILFKDFYVRPDTYNPLLDVTFDGVHILNKDIVSASPKILVTLKDESRFMALADTALLKVNVRFPDGSLKPYFFNSLLRFTPATLGSRENNATINFNPTFDEEGEYELIVTGKDVVGNKAGEIEYKVAFNVITKAMISNVMNYPNPFTTSTAFVFTITGTEVPQNIRIQILTITGKIVKEITKQELGNLRVGRNITDYKWDGTDAFGQKLANGVYLYRVITNLNGQSLEKYKSDGDKTDQYFKGGYGKMVLIR